MSTPLTQLSTNHTRCEFKVAGGIGGFLGAPVGGFFAGEVVDDKGVIQVVRWSTPTLLLQVPIRFVIDFVLHVLDNTTQV